LFEVMSLFFGGLIMRIALIGTTLGLSTAFASAAPTLVNDYNWLNLRPDKVTPFISGQPLGGSGNGTPTDFRWGGFV